MIFLIGLGIILCGILEIGVLVVWIKPEVFGIIDNVLFIQIVSTLLAWLVICLIALPSIGKDLKKKNKITPQLSLTSQIMMLDDNKDVKELRELRTLISFKLKNSTVNQNMIIAKKELCGKNCKCVTIKNSKRCTCGMFDKYVEYLGSTEESNN